MNIWYNRIMNDNKRKNIDRAFKLILVTLALILALMSMPDTTRVIYWIFVTCYWLSNLLSTLL